MGSSTLEPLDSVLHWSCITRVCRTPPLLSRSNLPLDLHVLRLHLSASCTLQHFLPPPPACWMASSTFLFLAQKLNNSLLQLMQASTLCFFEKKEGSTHFFVEFRIFFGEVIRVAWTGRRARVSRASWTCEVRSRKKKHLRDIWFSGHRFFSTGSTHSGCQVAVFCLVGHTGVCCSELQVHCKRGTSPWQAAINICNRIIEKTAHPGVD